QEAHMAFPSNIPTVEIRGRLLSPGMAAADASREKTARRSLLRVVFTPSVQKVTAPGADPSPVTFYHAGMPAPVEGITSTDGYLCTPDPQNDELALFPGVRLIATDAEQYSVVDWTWTVKVTSLDRKAVYETYSIGVPQAAAAAAAAAQDAQAAGAAAVTAGERATSAAASAAKAEQVTVTTGEVVGDDLILTKGDGSTKNAGNVRGPVGPAGPN